MTGYQTHQRSVLISFFEAHPDEAFTIDAIVRQRQAEWGGDAPSRSTVYRTVADLERENLLQRSYLADRRSSAYQYRNRRACGSHLHVRCERCNALMHLGSEVSGAIADLLRSRANVSLDVGGTVLAGVCDKCSRQT